MIVKKKPKMCVTEIKKHKQSLFENEKLIFNLDTMNK